MFVTRSRYRVYPYVSDWAFTSFFTEEALASIFDEPVEPTPIFDALAHETISVFEYTPEAW